MASQGLLDNPRRSKPMNPTVQTQNLSNSRFSWQQTPVQSQQTFSSRNQFGSPTTTIDESPLSASTMGPMHHPSDYGPAAATSSPTSHLQERAASPQHIHPAHFAPYAHPQVTRLQQQERQGREQEEEQEQRQDQHHPLISHRQQHQYQEPPKQHRISSPPPERTTTSPGQRITHLPGVPLPPIPPSPSFPQTSLDNKPPGTPRTPSYTPHSPFGPNTPTHHPSASLAAHLPGQSSHPNAGSSPRFGSGLCSADGLCLRGCFAPCALYGLTSFRLAQKAAHKDPTNLLAHRTCDGNAWLYGLSCGLCGVLACLLRGRVRRGYGIEGGLAGDCIRGCCCAPCVLGQAEREVKGREERWRRNEGPSLGYQMQADGGGMRYDPPPRQNGR